MTSNRQLKKIIAMWLYDYERSQIDKVTEGRIKLPEWVKTDELTKAHYYMQAVRLKLLIKESD